LLDFLAKRKKARFRIENHLFQYPEKNEFPDGNNLFFLSPGLVRERI